VKASRVLGIAGLLMSSGIIAGALAAHALREVLQPRQLESLHTAVNYQLFNALGLLVVGVLLRDPLLAASRLRHVPALLITGIVCFSGSIYLLLAGGPRWLGPVTPLGGVLLIAGWAVFALTLLRHQRL
jgi:uncharacterized membrane protein YgdD (TMEM256/DUF423 family)